MKHIIYIRRFAFDKIVNGSKRIDLRLYDDEHQKIKLNDVIEFVKENGDEKVLCLVRGIVICERFDDIIQMLPAKIFGYESKEEIKIRVERSCSLEKQMQYHVMGIMFMPLHMEGMTVRESKQGADNEWGRNEGVELKNSQIKHFSRVKQLSEEEEHWQPLSQMIEHSEDEGIDKDYKEEQLLQIRENMESYDR